MGLGEDAEKASDPRSLYETGNDEHLEFWAGHQRQKYFKKLIPCLMHKEIGRVPEE